MNLKSFLHLGLSRNTNFYRKTNGLVNVILVLHQLFILCSEAYYLDNNPYRHKRVLGPKTSFVVEWSVNWKDRQILFQISAETKGWIGFGLSKDGRMFNSDVIVGGIGPDGKPYFDDAHIGRNRSVQIDKQQDWRLNGAWEKGKRTYLSFSRAFDTCDFQDYPITSSLVVLIWAYGETDRVEYHMSRRGSFPVYLLDPQISNEIAHDHYRQIGPHSNLYLVQRWALANTIRLAPKPSSAWCSVQRGPRLSTRHDIVGMGPLLTNDFAKESVQQMLLYRCTSPQQTQVESFFEPYAKLRGEECFLNEKRTLPLAFCRELIYVWARGGEPFYFPEDIGIPIGESQNEYFLLETHIDNPKRITSLEVEAGVEIIFSHRQKPNGASLIQVGYGPFGVFMVPPKSVMNIYGSCGPKCTARMLPKMGANIFAAMLHSHSLGRRIRLRHFRSGQELPWILRDDNYDSEFQQMRLFAKERTILPGDQLITQCTFDSHERNRTSFSGFSTQDEACSAFVYVSTRIPFFRCTSEYPADRLMQKYGVNNFTWDLTWQERYVTDPKPMEGTWLGDVVDEEVGLRKSNSDQLQQDLQFSPHYESCPNIKDVMGQTENQLFKIFTNEWNLGQETPISTHTPYLTSTVSFPQNVQEYLEAPSCSTPIITSDKPDLGINLPLQPLPHPPRSLVDYPEVRRPLPSFPPTLPTKSKPFDYDDPHFEKPRVPKPFEFEKSVFEKPPFPSSKPFEYGKSQRPKPLEFENPIFGKPPPLKAFEFDDSVFSKPPPPPSPRPYNYGSTSGLAKDPLSKPVDITVPLVKPKGANLLQDLTHNQPIKAFFDRLADLITPKNKEETEDDKFKFTLPSPALPHPIPPLKHIPHLKPITHSVEPYFNEIIIPANQLKSINIVDDITIHDGPPKSIFNAIHGPTKARNLLKAAELSTNGFSYQVIKLNPDILKKKD